MKERVSKIFFWVLAVLILAAMMVVSRDAGISGDEDLHLTQSELVYRYFTSCGEDKSALHTPKTHLQYYGQSADNITTALAHWFKITDIYTLRHIFSTIAGWLTIMVTAIFAIYLAGYTAGILTLLLFVISPFFIGHSINNLKDIPFALAYITGIFFTIKFFKEIEKPKWTTAVLLVIGISLAISIRAGGLLMICYLLLYFVAINLMYFICNKHIDKTLKKQALWVAGISLLSYSTGLALWPYALHNPLWHPLESYQVMASFPTTLRQIFEGQSIWSDFLPWYYLPKYMLITIPLIVMAGVISFFIFSKNLFTPGNHFALAFVLFAIAFPMVFVVLKKANLYGSWRHFLFVYPCIILIAALGLEKLTAVAKNNLQKGVIIIALCVLSIHPLTFMVKNHPYHYLYYNQIVGGLKGAYGNYETDYYYHSIREGSEWLNNYLKTNNIKSTTKVGANFSTNWFFRNSPNVKTMYFPYTERSRYDWDYAIVANSYIHPQQLKNGTWPPKNAIHTIFADGVPICTVIERKTKTDFEGIAKLDSGKITEALPLLGNAVKHDPQNQYLWYKYAWGLHKNNQMHQAEFALKSGLAILPNYELALQLLGDMALEKGDTTKASIFYEKAISANIKFLAPYIKLANLYAKNDSKKARSILVRCLQINPRYKPAIAALSDTSLTTNAKKAKKNDIQANSIK